VEYRVAEKDIEVIPGFTMREVRRLCDSGHQTAVLTTRRDVPAIALAYRMFERWSQENFFKYMSEHYGLDQLCENGIEEIRPDFLVPNPARKRSQELLSRLREQLEKAEREYGCKMHTQPLRHHKKEDRTPDQLAAEITSLRSQIQSVKSDMLKLPKKLPLGQIPSEDRIVRLRYEIKHLTDTVKLLAYRAESDLYRLIAPFYSRSEEEGRALVREILASTADIIPNHQDHTLKVRYHTLATPRDNIALAKLCDALNELACLYPATDLRLVYEPPASVHQILA
jgi:hypothetical protein